MLARGFVFASAPAVCLSPLANASRSLGRVTRGLLYIHVVLVVASILLYLKIRQHFSTNLPDPLAPRLVTFVYEGCLCSVHRGDANIATLAFPGLGVTVDRMASQSFMRPFADASVLYFQPRGLGKSGFVLDFGVESLLEDALNCYLLFVRQFGKNVGRRYFVGFSLGCFMAMQLMASVPCQVDRLMCVGAMFDCRGMSGTYQTLASLLGIRTDGFVGRSATPVSILHAVDDKLSSVSEGRRLRDACAKAGREVTFMELTGGHSDFEISEEQQETLRGEFGG